MALREDEKAAVMALLIKQVEAQEAEKRGEDALAQAKAIIETSKTVRTNVRAALAVFGFDMKQEKPWSQVRDALGPELYSRAIRIGEGEEPLQSIQDLLRGQVRDEFWESDDEEEEASPSDPTPPNVRSIVLQQLETAGMTGLHASEIKDYLSNQGVETHEKTVGMTLYRLSKEGLARRERRTWFFVPEAQRKEPSDGRSRQDTSEGSNHQPEAEGGEARPGGGTQKTET